MAQEESFISHLVELRDRLLRSLIAVVVAFALLGFWPTYGVIYDFLALPLIKTLPAGSKMIATGVITPFTYTMPTMFVSISHRMR